MACIVALSSQVASGHVGLSAIHFALQRLGHEVIALPTVLLSNHPGRQPATGMPIAPAVIERMLATLDANGRLDHVDAVLTGYLPSAAHVTIAAEAITLCRKKGRRLTVLCDPVIGDDPKGVYIDAAAAAAIRDCLLPLADIATPNRFELDWLTGKRVADTCSAIEAARQLVPKLVIATSIPEGAEQLATLAITPTDAHSFVTKRLAATPNGTGDLLSALFLSAYLQSGQAIAESLERTVGGIDAVLAASAGHAELQMIASQEFWARSRT